MATRQFERPIEEQEVDGEIASSDLHWVLAADETEVPAEFDQELLEILQQPLFADRLPNVQREAPETQRDMCF